MNIASRLQKLEKLFHKSDGPRCVNCGSALSYLVATDASDTTRCCVCGTARPPERRRPLKAYLDVDPLLV